MAAQAMGQCTTFAPTADYLVGTRARDVTVGYFNADVWPDLAATHAWLPPVPGRINILLGDAGGTFQPAGSYPVVGNPWSVAAADFNGDQRSDLAVASDTAWAVSVLRNSGDGTFQPAITYPSPIEHGWFVETAQLDAGGTPDLVLSGSGAKIAVLLGNPDGTFQPAVGHTTNPAGDRVFGVGIGDVNGDGKTDLISANHDSADVSVFLGDGAGAFLAPVQLAVGGTPHSVAVADFDADGKQDLAVSGDGAIVNILRGNGNGTFQAATPYTGGGSDSPQVVAADFNSDGRVDLVATGGYAPPKVSILRGGFAGLFLPPVNFAVGLAYPHGVAVGDFDSDGRPDVATANLYLSSTVGGSVSVLLNTSGCYPDCNHDWSLTVADFGCFQTSFVGQTPYADCNQDTLLTIADFGCFQTKFIVACP